MTGGVSIERVVMQHWHETGKVFPDVQTMNKGELIDLIEGIPSGCYDELLAELRFLSNNKVEELPQEER